VSSSFILAIGLVLVIEGVVPFLFPRQWRDTFSRIAQFSEGQIRFLGCIALLCGLGTLYAANLFN
jgi:uncharacterized protein YjeT (DUF2065 family)